MNKFTTALWDWFFVLDQDENGTQIVPDDLKEETFEVIGFLSAFILLAAGVCSMVFFS